MKSKINPLSLSGKAVIHRIMALALLFFSPSIQADDFKKGLRAYEEGRYEAAAQSFEKILELGETAAVRHNLALSAYQSDLPAEAIWQLERALRIEPTNKEYQFKLGALRQQLGLSSGQPTWIESAARSLRAKQWGWLAAITLWGSFALWVIPFSLKIKPVLSIKIIRFLCLLVLGVSLPALEFLRQAGKNSILISEQAIELRAAPAQAAPETGLARSGERIRILESHEDYFKVETESEARGWIPGTVLKNL
jgi:tetratricopeptide (TPR) repeat protein